MAGTLKERYESKQLQTLKERVRDVDAQLLREERTARLILEAMDEEDLQKVTQIIQKLQRVKRPELPMLTKAIETAEAEINKYTAGGPLVKAWSKLKSKVGIDNPIVKVTTFASALEKGFSLIPQILKNNGVDLDALKGADVNQSLANFIAQKTGQGKKPTGAKTDAEMAKSPFTGKQVEGQQMDEADVKIEGKLKDIVDQLRKALSPGGVFGVFKKVPYMDSGQLAQELVQAPLKAFSEVAKTINAGAKAAEVAPDMKQVVTGAGEAETKGTAPGSEAKPAAQSGQAAPGKPTTVADKTKPTGETPPEPRGGGGEKAGGGGGAQKAFSDLKDSGVGKEHNVSDGAMKAILAALEEKGYLK